MRRSFVVFAVFLLLAGRSVAQTQSSASDVAVPAAPVAAGDASPVDAEASDQAAIRQHARDFVDAFNRQDAQALAALWTADGQYIDEAGQVYAGRSAIEDEYARFFAANDGARLQVVVDSIRLLSSDAAIEDGRAMLDPQPVGPPAITKYTAVHVKKDGRWLMATVRDQRIETPSAYNQVQDLEWLIGTWKAEEHGATMISVCRWVANKSYVERKYIVRRHDQMTSSGIQLIGFNPQGGHIQSWNFSSDGGHSIGIWTPREGGWVAEMQGLSGDGTATQSINSLTKIDDDAYAWQSVQRSAGGVALPDTDQIVMRRVTPN